MELKTINQSYIYLNNVLIKICFMVKIILKIHTFTIIKILTILPDFQFLVLFESQDSE